MNKFLFLFFIFLLGSFIFCVNVSAKDNISMDTLYQKGKVIKIIEEGSKKILKETFIYQILDVKILSGEDKGKILRINHGETTSIKEPQKAVLDEEIVISKIQLAGKTNYVISDKYRLPAIGYMILLFVALVVFFAKIKGLTSIFGMIGSILVLIYFVVPYIVRGYDPVLVTLAGSLFIVFVSMFLAHGFKKRIAIAVLSTCITLGIAVFLSHIFVALAKLSGLGSEDAYSLQFGQFRDINLKGLLLSGIIIGTLGVLDDITTSQSATVDEINNANKSLSKKDLYFKGISVGREHISSLVNTLILAYAGASLPIFFLFISLNKTQPLWVTLNSEFIVEEIVRSLVGSAALVLAVPMTTFLAVWFLGKKKK